MRVGCSGDADTPFGTAERNSSGDVVAPTITRFFSSDAVCIRQPVAPYSYSRAHMPHLEGR